MVTHDVTRIGTFPLRPDEFRPEAVIVANGEMPSLPLLKEWLIASPFTVCCDGAIRRFPIGHFRCNLVIGDGDSLAACQSPAPVIRISEQETNDLSKAVSYLQMQGKKRLAILGATGRRGDHMIGNVALLVHYLHRGITAVILDDYGVFLPCKDNVELKVGRGCQVSVFRFDAVGLRGVNLKYPLRDFGMLWQGILNEATDDVVQIHAKGYYLLYLVSRP